METISISSDGLNVLKFINQTNHSIFLTGKAGTGKTTLLRQIISTTHKNTVVVAPTGIAALNAGGVTIHSMFQLAPGGFVPDPSYAPDLNNGVKIDSIASLSKTFKMSGTKQAVIRALDLLVIDEVSMLRADLLDAMDFVMRRVRRKEQPFGGVQVLFIGDLLQLPPVVKNEEWHVLKNYYQGVFFFHAHVVQKIKPLYISLKKIFRQSDDRFIGVLNNLRNNVIKDEDMEVLSKYVKPDFDLHAHPGYIYLTTHNRKADEINTQSLDNLREKLFSYKAEVEGEFPDKMYPMDETLHLKVGAQIMFTKNDLSQDKRFYNGKMGVVKSLSKDEIYVLFPDENYTIEVEKYEWTNIRYNVNDNTKEVEEEVIGTFVHYPIKLAWAITVHKSQGLTFDKAILDVGDVFQPGQAYVALSRLRSMDGLVLVDMLKMRGIQNAQDVMSYAQNEADENLISQSLATGTKKFMYETVKKGFDFQYLISEWKKHAESYNSNAILSEKSKHTVWASMMFEKVSPLQDVSKRFSAWLDVQFSMEDVDYNGIKIKVMGATDHFFPTLDDVLNEVMTKMEELKRVKRVKEYFSELMNMEEMTLQTILGMTKSKLIIEAYIEGQIINKESLTNDFTKNYRSHKLEVIKEKVKATHPDLITTEDDTEDFSYYVRKPKKEKGDKKSTYQITYEMWLDKKSLDEIVQERKLTITTVQGHMARLIEEGKVSITEVLSDDKIRSLEILFEGYTGGNLSDMKEKAGENFTYGELRIFRGSLGLRE